MRSPLVALLAVLLVGCGPTAEAIRTPTPPPVATPSAPPPPTDGGPTAGPGATPSASTAPPPSAPPSDGSASASPGAVFQSVADFPMGDAFEVTGVTAAPSGFIAVGFGALGEEGYFGRRQGLVWRSPDGHTWQQAVEPAFEYVTPMGIAALGTDLFVIGVLASCPQIGDDTCTEVPEAGNAVWRSADGGAWERLPQLPSMQLGLVDGMVVGLGRAAVFGGAGDEAQTTTLWMSVDGANWTATTDLAGLDPITALAAGSAGFVAFGTRYVPEIENIELNAGVSADGVHFAAAVTPSLPGAAIEDAVAGPAGGFAGVGYSGSEDLALAGVVLYSADGLNWTQATDSDGSFAGSELIMVHALPNGYVALGFTPQADDFAVLNGRSWLSADGRSWRALAPVGESFTQLTASAIGAAGLVVFTADQQEVGEDSVTSKVNAWFAPIAGLTP